MIPGAAGSAAAIVEAATSLRLEMTAAQAELLAAYAALLERWNRTYNLTAARDARAIVDQHLTDCLAIVGPLRRELGALEAPRVLDVGSGGGLPGLVVAVLNPGWRVTCVDAVGKKAAFVRQASAMLGLSQLQAVHARVERLPAAWRFDVVTARAFASLSRLAELTLTSIAEGGLWAAMKGKQPTDEIDALPSAIEAFHVEPIVVPTLDAERCLVWMRRRHLS